VLDLTGDRGAEAVDDLAAGRVRGRAILVP
jgi:hypothetical protein